MSQRSKLKQLYRVLAQVKSHKGHMASLTDEELAGMTSQFRERLAAGETLDDLLPEAYAAMCEADYRVLGKFPYDAQILGGIALHQGRLIEMNTGEGKTLVATLPLYLNGLTGSSNILMTNNDYLALRDAEEMAPVYRFMGLTIAAGVQARGEESFDNDKKREIYGADIVYTTHSIFGFDYLFNNLVTSAEERFMRALDYVIIDEADAVLLDGAQTPLVISGSPRVQSNLYEMADFFVTTLVEGRDYEKEDGKVWLTEAGVKYTEDYFKIDNFYGAEFFEINRHVTLALRAHALFDMEKDYMISQDGELQLLDGGSGRMMPGVKLRGGQHQALECKEKVEISRENRSVASITFQNLFQLFNKLSGMSGTISDAEDELKSVYGSEVIVIPPNCPLRRKDLPDFYFADTETQFKAAIKLASDTHKTGQPVLVVVSSIAESEKVSNMLIEERIPHSVLNANNAYWEAEIIKEAGQMNTVTVATAMAGRGTDIRLGEGVRELGGLGVIGIGRMSNVRQERQARGRAGRQGDPGFSRFFVSLQDEIVKRNGLIDTEKYADGKKRISKGKLKKVINTAQSTGEEFAVLSRRHAMEYDQVMQRQRALIYETRNQLLDGEDIEMTKIVQIAKENVRKYLDMEESRERKILSRYILDNISYKLDDRMYDVDMNDDASIIRYVIRLVSDNLRRAESKFGTEQMNDYMRVATLQAIDDAWVEQVDYLQQLQAAVSGRSLAQRNPVYEYQKDALESFTKMENTILINMIRNILLGRVYFDSDGKLRIILP
ncbi:MAG: accessory Sec system translocase SecA2 [Lachnospiraceae bacterium]|nr:accessory Sec system translocase SecA2 [Lachnospiraceae bacterium]